jgi:hypothetical protein
VHPPSGRARARSEAPGWAGEHGRAVVEDRLAPGRSKTFLRRPPGGHPRGWGPSTGPEAATYRILAAVSFAARAMSAATGPGWET